FRLIWAYLCLDFWREKILGVGLFGFRFMQGFYPPSLAEGARGWVVILRFRKKPKYLKAKIL
ncbi:hypothetical protein, partial [Helicobacter sp. T3_23-1059]